MALILWPLLLSIPIPFVWAHPAPSTSLSPYITRTVPACGRTCLQTFIANNYPIQVCTAQNLNCLCINPSTSGYTLGEAALKCIYSNCRQADMQANKAYDICGDIPGTQPNKYQVDTSRQGSSSTASSTGTRTGTSSSKAFKPSKASKSSASSTASSIVKTSISSTSTFKSTISSTRTNASPSTSSLDIPISNTGPTTTATSTSTSSSTAPSAPNTSLTKPQIAGVAVAVVGAAALSFGFCFFWICYRRRGKRSNRRPSDTSMIGDKIASSRGSTPDLAGVSTRDFSHHRDSRPQSKPPLKVVTPSQGGWQEWARNTPPSPHGIGLALAPETSHQTKEGPSPITPRSYKTNSQLLPDKPRYSVFPATSSKLAKRQSRSLHPPISTYAPENSPPMNGPRFPSSMDTSQANLQRMKRNMSDPFYNDQHSPPFEGYRGVPYTPWTNPSANVRKSTPRYPVTETATTTSQSVQQPTMPGANQPPLTDWQMHSAAAMDRSHSQKLPPRKKSASSSRYTRFSNDSGTSFEDIDDDPSPPKSALSPVTEVRSPPQSTERDSIPPLPIKSFRRNSSVVNRPRPVPRRPDFVEPGGVAEEIPTRDVTQTAKWKILVSPGLQSLDESLPSSPRTPTTAGRTPHMPSDKLPRPPW